MSDEMNEFWAQLQEQARDPEGFRALTEAEAERRMAEAGEEPMSDQEIADIVRKATAEGPQGIVHRDIEKPQARYFMKVAAAVMITIALVAGVVSTKAMLWPEREDPLSRFGLLKYRDAILIALNGKEEESARNSSVGRILVSIRAGIRGLQRVPEKQAQLRSVADDVLRILRQTLHGPALFEEQDLSRVHALKHPVKDSVAFIQNASKPMAHRVRRVRELGDQLQLGVLAFKKVQAVEAPQGRLGIGARRALRHLNKQLGQ